MYRSTLLKSTHYAGQWIVPDQNQRNDLQQVNLLGYDYATSPDGPEKEAKLLKVLEHFHGYRMKYLCMIVRGTVPPAGTVAGKDSKELGAYPVPETKASSNLVVRRTALSVHTLSLAATGSGTVTIPILILGATNANLDGSPRIGVIVNSIGSSGLFLPHIPQGSSRHTSKSHLCLPKYLP
jgi:hypothetical protein